MTWAARRTFLAQLAIVLAACIGGWMMLIEPQMRKIERAEAALEEHRALFGESGRIPIEDLARRLVTIRRSLARVEQRSQFGRDSSELYGAVLELAAAIDVDVQNVNPGELRAQADGRLASREIDLALRGSYEQIAGFLRAIEDLPGYVRIVTVNLQPRVATEDLVEARVSCELICFTIPESVRLVAEGGVRER